VATQCVFEVVTLPATAIAVGVATALASWLYDVAPGDWWYVALLAVLLSPVVFTLVEAARPITEPFLPLGGSRWLVITVAARTLSFGGLAAFELKALRIGFGLGALVALLYAAAVRAWTALSERSGRVSR